jgi:hypothetical protein
MKKFNGNIGDWGRQGEPTENKILLEGEMLPCQNRMVI